MADVGELLWLLRMLDDVESDLSVFHRIEEMHRMPSARWVRLATRLPAYAGAVSARLRLRAAAASSPESAPEAAAHARPAPIQYRRGAPSMFWSRATSGGEAA